MTKLILFTSSKCPDCPPVIEKMEQAGLDFENVDITDSMPNLKRFLMYRDNNDYFTEIKDSNRVGVPSLMVSEGEFVNPEKIEDFNRFK